MLAGLLVARAFALARLVPREFLPWIAGGVATASLVAYLLYAADKRRAQTPGAARTPEAVLHLWELLGGWPGALLAQRRLRHKNAKITYQFAFWLIVLAHQTAAIDALLGWRLLAAARDLLFPR